jgi:hypothetical protein
MRCLVQQFPHAHDVERVELMSTRTTDVLMTCRITHIATGYASRANSSSLPALKLRTKSCCCHQEISAQIESSEQPIGRPGDEWNRVSFNPGWPASLRLECCTTSECTRSTGADIFGKIIQDIGRVLGIGADQSRGI